jgi:hypothetical protein
VSWLLRNPAGPDAGHALDAARARLERAGEERQQRRLAGAVRPHERERLASVQLEIERVERHPRAVAAPDAVRAEEQRPGVPSGPAPTLWFRAGHRRRS